jgi:cysteine desulfurase family protein (TIGR01976 family)
MMPNPADHEDDLPTPRRPSLDLDHVRRHFPALAGDTVFFDNAGGSQALGEVADRIAGYLRTTNVQLGASYSVSQASGARVDAGVRAVASLFGASDPSEVVLGPSATQLVSNLAAALGPSLREGDEIIVTEADHEANIGAWRRLSARGVVVREWPVDRERAVLDPEALEPLLNPRTRLVAMTHCSNVVGSIHPVREVARRVHAHGALLFVDGVAYAPHAPIDVAALEVDGYFFSLYKVYGPHMSAMWLRRDLFDRLACINHDFLADIVPYKIQPGGMSYELAWSTTAIAEYFDNLGASLSASPRARSGSEIPELPRARAFEAIAAHEQALSARLLEGLSAIPGVRIIGDPSADRAARVPTISFVVEGTPSSAIPPRVDPHGIGIRFGDFYARRLIDALGLRDKGGVVRVSMVHYNTLSEVDRLLEVLDRALR